MTLIIHSKVCYPVKKEYRLNHGHIQCYGWLNWSTVIESRVDAYGEVESEWEGSQRNFLGWWKYSKSRQLFGFWAPFTDTYMQRPLVLLKWIRLGSVAFLGNQGNWVQGSSEPGTSPPTQTSEAGEDLRIERTNIWCLHLCFLLVRPWVSHSPSWTLVSSF